MPAKPFEGAIYANGSIRTKGKGRNGHCPHIWRTDGG